MAEACIDSKLDTAMHFGSVRVPGPARKRREAASSEYTDYLTTTPMAY